MRCMASLTRRDFGRTCATLGAIAAPVPVLARLSLPGADRDAAPDSVTPACLPFELREQFQVVVPGSIGSIDRLKLLVDTGSIPSMIDRRIARKLGLAVGSSETVAFGDRSRVHLVTLPSVVLGPMRAHKILAHVGDLSFLHGIDAIIGVDVLLQSSFRIDYAARAMSFGPVIARGPSLPLEVTPPFLTVNLTFAGRPFRLLVDTGSRRLMLFQRRVRDRLPVMNVDGERVIYHASGATRFHCVTLPDLNAGGFPIARIEGLLSDAPVDGYPAGIDGVLGVRALASRLAEFDFERARFGFQ